MERKDLVLTAAVLLLAGLFCLNTQCGRHKTKIPTEKDMGAYLFVYHKEHTHSLYFALSDDGYTFTDVNGDRPIVGGDTIALQKGIRDPQITRGKDGAFYIAMTDCHVDGKAAGYRTTRWERDEKIYGWGNNRGFVLMKSFDLIHWTHSNVTVQDLFPDLEVSCAWAPQTVYDPGEDKMMLYFTLRLGIMGKSNLRLYYAYTDDGFTTLLTRPQLLFDYPDSSVNILDGDITPLPDGRFCLMYVAGKKIPGGIEMAFSNKINGDYVYQPGRVDFEPLGCEAPNVWKRIGEDRWVLMYDVYGVKPHNFGFAETTDFKTFTNIGHFDAGVMRRTNFSTPREGPAGVYSAQKHGAVIQVTKEEAGRLAEYYKRNNN
ncbi:MAG: glycoside hydrolase family 43 protein [Tannerella sp.]|jgi:predicted GH43/DUF377 family glycosyl hydrolase|nr:glycoside hydrolase family 43 protein [Tannerella sp.]